MSDVSDASGPVQRRAPRAADGGAPASGALAIGLAIVAVVLGFLILRSITDGGDQDLGIAGGEATGVAAAPDEQDDSSTAPDGSGVPTLAPPTTTAGLTVQGATVVVANANGIGGSAKKMSDALGLGPGFTMGAPENRSSAIDPLETTQIYFDPNQPGAQAVADSVNLVLGGNSVVAALPAGTPPVEDGSIDGAGVLVMLGLDKAEKTLADLNPTLAATTATAPAVVGSVATTTPTTVA